MPEQPEVAILRLSNAEYAEFVRDKKGFINKHHIFPKNVNRLCAESESRPDLEEYRDVSGNDAWLVMIEHDWNISNFIPHSMLLFRPTR